MKTLLIVTVIFLFINGCTNKGPDVSNIHVNINIHRFDQFLFEKVDTNNIAAGITMMHQQFPFFAKDFIVNILQLPDVDGSTQEGTATITYTEMKRFLRITKPLYDSLKSKFTNTASLHTELVDAFQHVKYYYPSYKVPEIVTYIGPFDAPAVAITPSALAIGLQLYGGKDFSFYSSTMGQELYPMYISRRFEPSYITANSMKAVTEDIYPDRTEGKPLIEQMINKGKEWWLLDKFLPSAPDSIKTGYTQQQLEWCKSNEGLIYTSFLQTSDLYTIESSIIKTYLGEGPGTDGMPKSAPGNIGQWVGWQIVKAYADNHPEIKPEAVMNTDARKIFNEARYKPR